jgi:hypothetical protein
MSKSDTINLQMNITISKRWVPTFIGFINKLAHNSRNGHSSLIGFYADGDGDFGFKANIPVNENQELLRDFGCDSWTGERVVDSEKAIGKPVAKDVECPALWCHKVEEVYDAN